MKFCPLAVIFNTDAVIAALANEEGHLYGSVGPAQIVEALAKEQNEKITAVLTPEQSKKVEELRAAAKAKRSPKTPPKKKPAAD